MPLFDLPFIRRALVASIFPVGIFLGTSASVLAAPGDPEVDFNPGIHHGQVVEQAIPQPDGRILIGTGDQAGTASPTDLIKLNPDGTRDSTFQSEVNGGVDSIVTLANGKVVIGGGFTAVNGEERLRVARFNPDGTLDSAFQPAVDGGVACLLPQAGGKLIVGGLFASLNGQPQAWIGRLNENGSTDGTFVLSVDGNIRTIVAHPDGRFYICGAFTTVNGVARTQVARLHADGALDESFAPVFNDQVDCLTVQPDGSTLLGGRFTTVDGATRTRIVRIKPDGSLDAAFAVPNGHVYSIALQADGKIIIAGSFATVTGQARRRVARLLASGALDGTLVPTLSSLNAFLTAALQPDGKILVGGGFPVAAMQAPDNVERLAGSAATQSLTVTSGERVEWLRGGASPEVLETTFELSVDGGSTWQMLGAGARITGGWELTGLSLPVAGAIRARGGLCTGYKNGSSTLCETVAAFGPAAPVIAIEAPDGSGLTDGVGTVSFAANRSPQTFVIKNAGTAPLVIGQVTTGAYRDTEYHLNVSGMRTCLPAGAQTSFTVTLEPYGTGARAGALTVASNDASANPFDIALSGPGALSSQIPIVGMNLFRDRSTPWQDLFYYFEPPFVRGVTNYKVTIPNNLMSVQLATAYDRDFEDVAPLSLAVNGVEEEVFGATSPIDLSPAAQSLWDIEFTAEDGVTKRNYNLEINRAAAQPGDVVLPFNAGFKSTDRIYASAALSNGQMLIGGAFTAFQGGTKRNLVRLNADGTLDETFTANPSSTVEGILALPDGKVMIFGAFTTVNGTPRRLIARLFENGALDTDFDPVLALNFGIRCAAVEDDGRILIGGFFHTVNNIERYGLARLNPDGSLDPDFAPEPEDQVSALAVQHDGKILIGGDFTEVAGQPATRLARLNKDGTFDSTFSASANDSVFGIAIQADDKIIISGWFDQVNGDAQQFFARLNPNGTSDAEFAWPSENLGMLSFGLRADGKILAAGEAPWVYPIVRLNADGSFDNGFDANRLDLHSASGVRGYGVLLRGDGSVLVTGGFASIGGVPINAVVRLHDDPAAAPSAPQVNTANHLVWQEEGTMPVAERVLFQLSTDAGATWSGIGHGRRNAGVWELTHADLPPGGKVRAMAYLKSGYRNSSQGLLVSPAEDFSFAPAEIVVEQPAGSGLTDGGAARDFGGVGLKATQFMEFIVKNVGETNLKLGGITIDGPDAAMFAVAQNPAAEVAGGDSTLFTVTFTPTKLGAKSAVLHLSSNDGDQTSFDIPLTGTGIGAVPPVVKTLAAQVTSHSTAILKGSIDAKGSERTVVFDYGTTSAYGMSAALPATAAGTGVQAVEVAVAGLQPHTTYHYRIRAAGFMGSASGAKMTFTTANRFPVVADDAFKVVRGSVVVLPILSNDSDPDGDALTLASITAPPAAARVKVVKQGNTAQVTFNAESSGPVTFTYKVSDGFGGTATGSVTLTTDAVQSINPDDLDLSAVAQTVQVLVSADGVAWAAQESVTWLSCAPVTGVGSGLVSVTVQANTSKNPRSAVVSFGAGKVLTVNQAGVGPPTVTAPDSVPTATIRGYYELEIPTVNRPVTYTVTNLPPGLVMDQAAGVIKGIPTKAGEYDVTVKARNAAGAAPASAQFTITVIGLPEGSVGTFHGYIGADQVLNRLLGARFEVVTTAAGGVTGKIITGAASQAFAGRLTTSVATQDQPQFTVNLERRGSAPVPLVLTFNAATNDLAGTLGGVAFTAWRQRWTAEARPDDYAGLYSFYLTPPSDAAELPQGHGFGSYTVDPKTGALKVTAKLADGNTVLTTTFVGPQGQVLLYQSLYGNKGSFGGTLQMNVGYLIAGNPAWYKPQGGMADRVYKAGFGPAAYAAAGGIVHDVPSGQVILGLENEDGNALLDFQLGGLEVEGKEFDIIFSLRNPKDTGLTHTATFPADNPNKVTLAMPKPAAGGFAGTFTIPGATRALDRKVTYEGQVVNDGFTVRGYGFFLLPEPAAAAQMSKAPKRSGRIILDGK